MIFCFKRFILLLTVYHYDLFRGINILFFDTLFIHFFVQCNEMKCMVTQNIRCLTKLNIGFKYSQSYTK